AEITRVADELIATSPRVLAKPGADVGTLARSARELGFTGPVEAITEPTDALAAAIARAGRSDLVLVTGSLYLVGNVRGHWYPDDEIVVRRTPWPAK
ncbi:MAG: bifunctional folylpolyglutamate synthase/dihydrofolate synthase, partial [Thermomicrobiales bacterium]|nr:bifunctional folylpolyglutamate synthase/dihydrofolate synthase [Thermomicrobiales bacterium]